MLKRFYLVVACCICLQATYAKSEFDLEYTTEIQSEFKRVSWLNQLHFACTVPIGRHFAFEGGTYSFAKTLDESIIEDMQGFSNIDADNFPFALSVFSINWNTEHTTLSLGIRNLNENYFDTDLTGFFTQSSHGIFPTVAANFPIANYPLASVGMDFQCDIEGWRIDASVYNGQGYLDVFGKETVFRFSPKKDGIFGALSLSNEGKYGNAHIGGAFRTHQGNTLGVVWTYAEIRICDVVNLLAQYSIAPKKDVECRTYAGLGLTVNAKRTEIGVAESYARFSDADEWATEISAKIPIRKNIVIQPAVHICAGEKTNCVAFVRLYYGLAWRKQE